MISSFVITVERLSRCDVMNMQTARFFWFCFAVLTSAIVSFYCFVSLANPIFPILNPPAFSIYISGVVFAQYVTGATLYITIKILILFSLAIPNFKGLSTKRTPYNCNSSFLIGRLIGSCALDRTKLIFHLSPSEKNSPTLQANEFLFGLRRFVFSKTGQIAKNSFAKLQTDLVNQKKLPAKSAGSFFQILFTRFLSMSYSVTGAAIFTNSFRFTSTPTFALHSYSQKAQAPSDCALSRHTAEQGLHEKQKRTYAVMCLDRYIIP